MHTITKKEGTARLKHERAQGQSGRSGNKRRESHENACSHVDMRERRVQVEFVALTGKSFLSTCRRRRSSSPLLSLR